MASLENGKDKIIEWIKSNFKEHDTCLDVGACDGKYSDLLNGYMQIDAVEVFKPYIEKYNLESKYSNVFNDNIVGLEYRYYDLIIFGDVIEHLSVEDAQKVIEYAKPRCKDMIIAVPFNYEQDIIDDNEYQIHLQPDLNFDVFEERYKGFRVIYFDIDKQYCYYAKYSENVL